MNSKIARALSLIAVVAIFCLSLAGCTTSGTAGTDDLLLYGQAGEKA